MTDQLGLKPCPFCQGHATIKNGKEYDSFYVECLECGASTKSVFLRPQAITAWNTRADDWQPIENDPEFGEWQDIATAPTGAVIVYDKKKGVIPDAFTYAGDTRATYGYYNNTAYDVTHWMPLPTPPKEGE